MMDYANDNRPDGATPVYIIPGHRMMARLYDDIALDLVPGISDISDFFGDNIHPNSLGDYAVAMIHYACIFNESPLGLSNDLMPDPPAGFQMPSPELALYLQTMIWEVVTTYPRTGIANTPTSISDNSLDVESNLVVYPNPATDIVNIDFEESIEGNMYLMDINGKTIKTQSIANQNIQIDVSEYAKGIYFLKIMSLNNIVVKQIVKR
ncbi:MAG: T9SS type A sorting domain-containing protein [Chitinophagales bacterium]